MPAALKQVRQGVYWCDRAFDKGAKGGKVWRVDVDGWREGGKSGQGWGVSMTPWEGDSSEEEGSDDEFADKPEVAPEAEEEGTEEGDDSDDDGLEGKGAKKRKSTARAAGANKKPRIAAATSARRKRLAHPTQPATFIPSSIPALESLPTDPYERALRLLHVGATPESLPCREEEFVEVLGKVEEGVESGGGGCLCTSCSL